MASGLVHKSRKCVVIPVAAPCRLPYVDVFKEAILRLCPEWYPYAVVGHHKIVGYEVGPEAGYQSWASPLAKTKLRLNCLNGSGCAPSLACSSFITKVLPIVSHVAQLGVPPRAVYDLEKLVVNKLYHAPPADLTIAVGVQARSFGGVKVPALASYCLAVLWRAAHSLALDTPSIVLERNEDELDILRVHEGRRWSPHWLAPAFASVLKAVRYGQPAAILPAEAGRLFAALRGRWAGASPAARRRPQAWATEQLDALRFPAPIAGGLATRCSKHIFATTAEEVSRSMEILRKARAPRLASAWVKSITLGFNTSARLHHALIGPCIWCREERHDNQQHLFTCAKFHEAFHVVIGKPFDLRSLLLPQSALDAHATAAVHTAYNKSRFAGLNPLRALQAAWRIDGPPPAPPRGGGGRSRSDLAGPPGRGAA